MCDYCCCLIADYEQVTADSGDEAEQDQEYRVHKRNSLSSSYYTASTSIDTNESIQPLNDSTATDNILIMGTNAAPPIYGDDYKMASNFDKFRLLMWKNFLLQYRHRVQTIVEILVPVLFSVILVLIRSIVDPDLFPANTIYKPFEINNINPLR